MLGAIYGSSFDMDSFTAWNSSEQGRSNYATNKDIMDHTSQHVLPNLPPGTGAVYVLDNASNNKKIDDTLKDKNQDGIQDWIINHDPDAQRFQKFWEKESPKCTGATDEKKMLFKYIRANIDDFTELAIRCRENDTKLRYLPAYYPECNPIELIWAHIKREYKATDSSLPWRQRLDMAHEKITDELIDASFDKSIRYCLDRLQELRTTEDVHGGGGDRVIYDDDADSDDEWINKK